MLESYVFKKEDFANENNNYLYDLYTHFWSYKHFLRAKQIKNSEKLKHMLFDQFDCCRLMTKKVYIVKKW